MKLLYIDIEREAIVLKVNANATFYIHNLPMLQCKLMDVGRGVIVTHSIRRRMLGRGRGLRLQALNFPVEAGELPVLLSFDVVTAAEPLQSSGGHL